MLTPPPHTHTRVYACVDESDLDDIFQPNRTQRAGNQEATPMLSARPLPEAAVDSDVVVRSTLLMWIYWLLVCDVKFLTAHFEC